MNGLVMMSCLWALLLLLAPAQAQAPKPCVSPDMMSGSFSVMGASGLLMSMGHMSYDNYGQRAHVQSYGIVNGTRPFSMDLIMLFREKVYYEINWTKLSCKMKALDDAFIPMHVPKDAKLMGQVFMGSTSGFGMGVLVNTWEGKLPQNGTYNTVFTEVGCIPMTYTSYSPTSWSMMSTYNWVIGNTDPMKYNPPFFCPKKKSDESEAPSSFFKVIEEFAQKVKSEEA